MSKNISRDTLYQLFVIDNLSTRECTEQLGISRTQFYRLLREHNIKERKGVANPNAPTKETLYHLYVEENLSAKEIAERYGWTDGNTFYYLRRYGITRDRSERNSRVPPREMLYHLYVEENLTAEEIAERIGYSRSRVFVLLERYGIERNRREFTTNIDPPPPPVVAERPYGGTLDRYHRIPDATWLRARYWDDNLNVTQIAQELGVNPNSITKALHRYNIPIKPRHLCWQDKPRRFGDFSQSQRRRIRERDKQCKMCGSMQNLECHHIIPTRIGGRNSIENGILLCNVCHDQVGFCETRYVDLLLQLLHSKDG